MQSTVKLLEVKNLQKYFTIHKTFSGSRKHVVVHAAEDISFDLYSGETFGIVGESGCGKSTTARLILRLLEPTGGSVLYRGEDLLKKSRKEMRMARKDLQIVFQDPFSSLDPRMTIGKIIEESMINFKMYSRVERRQKVLDLMEKVGLSPTYYGRYPAEFSGGQRQRIGIARALASQPKLLIADEPVSALDVSVQSQVLNLMKDLQKSFHLTYLFISHDLSVVKHICDRICVMYLGRIVEQALTDELYDNPLHPYTQSLISVVPVPDPKGKKERILLSGEVPNPANPPRGCAFHNRCPRAMKICSEKQPQMYEVGQNHLIACHLYSKTGDVSQTNS